MLNTRGHRYAILARSRKVNEPWVSDKSPWICYFKKKKKKIRIMTSSDFEYKVWLDGSEPVMFAAGFIVKNLCGWCSFCSCRCHQSLNPWRGGIKLIRGSTNWAGSWIIWPSKSKHLLGQYSVLNNIFQWSWNCCSEPVKLKTKTKKS